MAVKSDLSNRYNHLALDGLSQTQKNILVARAYERTYKIYDNVMTKATISTKDGLADAFLYGVIEGRMERPPTLSDPEAIVAAARDMREKQRTYFRTRSPVDLGLAKSAEAHLDRLLSSPTLPGLHGQAHPHRTDHSAAPPAE